MEIAIVAGWFNPFEGAYGSGVGHVSDGAGVLTLDHAAEFSSRLVMSNQKVSGKNIQAFLVKQFSVGNAGDAGGVERIHISCHMYDDDQSGGTDRIELFSVVDSGDTSKYFWRMRDDVGGGDTNGTTLFAFGTKYDLKLITGFSPGTWKFFVDEVEEMSVVETLRWIETTTAVNQRLLGEGSVHASKTRNEGVALVAYDDASEEPNCTDTIWDELVLNAESATYNDYDLGSGASPHPDYLNVDDWRYGDADDDDTRDRMAGTAGVTRRQGYGVVTYSPVNGQQAVRLMARHRAGTGGKNMTGTLFIYDGTDITYGLVGITPDTSYTHLADLFRDAPDGTPWKTWDDWGNLELAHRTITDPLEAGDTISLTAIMAEVLDLAIPVAVSVAAPIQVMTY